MTQQARDSEIDRLGKIIDRAQRYQNLFKDETFIEFWGLIKSKQSRYDDMARNPPRVGSFRTYPQVSVITTEIKPGDIMRQTTETKVPFKVSLEEQVEHIKEYNVRANEAGLIFDLPKSIEIDAKRAQMELERIQPKQQKSQAK